MPGIDPSSLARAERSERRRRATGAGVLALLALGVGWLALHSAGAVDRASAVTCGTRYARARTAAETLVVDGQRPRETKAGQMELRCGELRRRGLTALRPR